MSIWDSLRGHAEQREMFRRTISRNRLSQSYVFAGPPGIGKRQFARRLAQCLLCRKNGDTPLEACGECVGCRPFLAGSHPDFLQIGCPEGKRELPIALLVGAEERRGQEGLCHDLSVAPLPGSRKVAIIDDADTMNDASANSFLKTLEEPPDRAILMLIVSNLDALLPTIKSRCQLVRFSPLQASDIEALLLEQDLVQSAEDARFASSHGEGSLELASQLLEPELRALRVLLYSQISLANFHGLALSKKLLEGLATISSEIPVQRRNSQWLIGFAVDFFRSAIWNLTGQRSDRFRTIAEAESFSQRIACQANGLERLGTALDRCVDASCHIDQNVPVSLAMDSLFEDLSRIFRESSSTR